MDGRVVVMDWESWIRVLRANNVVFRLLGLGFWGGFGRGDGGSQGFIGHWLNNSVSAFQNFMYTCL